MNADIDISNVVLKTRRLILRPFALSDLEDFYEYASVDGVGQMAGWLPHESRDISLGILNQFMEEKKTFALELDGKVIGSLGIEQYKESDVPEFDPLACREIGYVLAKDDWGRGLMAEAVRELLRWLFEDVGLDLIFCSHFLLGSLCHLAQLRTVIANVGHFVGHDQMVLRINSSLHVVAYNPLAFGDHHP